MDTPKLIRIGFLSAVLVVLLSGLLSFLPAFNMSDDVLKAINSKDSSFFSNNINFDLLRQDIKTQIADKMASRNKGAGRLASAIAPGVMNSTFGPIVDFYVVPENLEAFMPFIDYLYDNNQVTAEIRGIEGLNTFVLYLTPPPRANKDFLLSIKLVRKGFAGWEIGGVYASEPTAYFLRQKYFASNPTIRGFSAFSQ